MALSFRLGALRQRRLGCSGTVENHLLQNREIVEVAPAPQRSDSIESLRPPTVRTFGKAHQAGLLQNLKMTVQIAVGERTELFHFRERQPSRVRDQAGQHAQTRALMNDAIQAIVGKWGSL
jgi:hypothetical protein